MYRCSLFLCRAVGGKFSIHRFPSSQRPIERHQWTEMVRLDKGDNEWLPGANSCICSRHFDEDQLFNPPGMKPRVQPNSVPSKLIRNYAHGDVSTEVHDPSPSEIPMDISPTIEPSFTAASGMLNLPSYRRDYNPDDLLLAGMFLCGSVLYRHHKIVTCQVQLGLDDFSNDVLISSTKLINLRPKSPLKRKATEPTPFQTPPLKVLRPGARRSLFNDRATRPEPKASTSTSNTSSDHSYSSRITPRTANKKISMRKVLFQQQNHRMHIKIKRQECKIRSLQGLIAKIRREPGIESRDIAMVKNYSTVLRTIISTENQKTNVKGSKGMRYTDEMKKFAVTLHFYSPKAYRFLRKHFTLPHENSLSEWMKAVDCGPGISVPVLDALENLRLKDPSTMTDIVLILDEMAIKKDVKYDKHKGEYLGHVDFGNGPPPGDAPLATTALVALVAGLKGNWKEVVSYAFTDHVDAETQHTFAQSIIVELTKRGFTVHAVILDGSPANKSTLDKFGVDEKDMDSKFVFPDPVNEENQICGMYDAVHLLKLWRGLWFKYRILYTPRGDVINIRFVEELYNLQTREMIRGGNKLSKTIMEWQKTPMKVKLAAQLFSESIADTIDFCRDDLQLPEFEGSAPTSDFIRKMNHWFDVMNSRHPSQHYQKAPIRLANLSETESFLSDFKIFIWDLQVTVTEKKKVMDKVASPNSKNVSTPSTSKHKTGTDHHRKTKMTYKTIIVKKTIFLRKSLRKRAVLGSYLTTNSIMYLAKKLLTRTANPFKFFLTYRCSQDLLELEFCKIRSRLGANDNPDVVEFRHIIKKLWHVNSVRENDSGNCLSQQNKKISGGLFCLRRCPKVKVQLTVEELDSLQHLDLETVSRTLFYNNSLVYISGNVAKVISEKEHCAECSAMLFHSPEDPVCKNEMRLTERKERGGLVFPSGSVVKLIKSADQCFRNVVSGTKFAPTMKNLNNIIIANVLRSLVLAHTADDGSANSRTLFPAMTSHTLAFDPNFEESHLVRLAKSVINHLLKIRLGDYGARFSKEIRGATDRHKYTKLVQFKGE